MNNETSSYKHRIEFVELHCLFLSYSYSEIFYSFKYQFPYLHAVQTKPCVNMERSEWGVTRLWCASANIVKVSAKWKMRVWQNDSIVKTASTSCWFHSTGRESGPSSLSTAVSRTSEVGVSGVSWERSSEHLLTVGEITSGLVSHDSVLCSELAVVVVVATLRGTGSNSSSSSSRMCDSWISAEETQIF